MRIKSSLPHLAISVICVISLCALLAVVAIAQGTIRVPMRIVPATAGAWPVLSYPAEPGPFTAPGDLQLKSLAPASSGCKFQLPDGTQVSIRLGGWQAINVRRASGLLPYAVTCEKVEENGKNRYVLEWRPQYRAEGTMQVGDCRRLIEVSDLNGDGVFDRRDLTQGTALGVDVNDDKLIWGKGEFFGEGSVFEVCGKRWEVASLSPLGDWIEFRESGVPQFEIGAPSPVFILHTDDGKAVSSSSFRGRWYLIDFWAAWCVPCMEKFPDLKQLGQEMGQRMDIYLVNVDSSGQVTGAKQAIAKYALPYPKTWDGKGEDDPTWRIFGTKVDNFLVIPLYVLVDSQGRVALITHDLNDVRAHIASH